MSYLCRGNILLFTFFFFILNGKNASYCSFAGSKQNTRVMKRRDFFIFRRAGQAVLSAAIALSAVSCGAFSYDGEDDGDAQEGLIRVNFNETDFRNVSDLMSAYGTDMPSTDTSAYYLEMVSDNGNVIYSGSYGDRPDVFEVSPGKYDLKVLSTDKYMPAYSTPVLGDYQSVEISHGEELSVSFLCRQLNGGIRIISSESLRKSGPECHFLFNYGRGTVKYPLDETRFLYFFEGGIKIDYVDESDNSVELLRRNVNPGEMLTLKAGEDDGEGNSPGKGGILIETDTSRVWITENLDFDNMDVKSEAISVSEAKRRVGEEDIWVCGYIVGGNLSSSSVKCEPPFSSQTNMAIADSWNEKDRKKMMSVELPSGSVREALNLVSHPDNLGRRVYLKGNVAESYFGLTGLKRVKDYRW